MRTLFDAPRFGGLDRDGFEVFSIPDRDRRRRAIIRAFHPTLQDLGQDLIERLEPHEESSKLHAHLPRLDWPREYQPFCTWLALSTEAHGYQAGPQLNVGIHPDHVGVRLAWDVAADRFGRFEFLCRHGRLREPMLEAAESASLRFRVYAAAPWPEGSVCVFDSPDDLAGSFDEVRRRGVWWELGERYPIPEALDRVCVPEFCAEATRVLTAVLRPFHRFQGDPD